MLFAGSWAILRAGKNDPSALPRGAVLFFPHPSRILRRKAATAASSAQAAQREVHSRLGAAADELADEELVGDDTLLMILNAALIARFGPKVMEIGRGNSV